MRKLIEVSGTLRSAAYIENKYLLAGDKVKNVPVIVTENKSLAAEVIELDEDSKKLVEKTIKDLQSQIAKNRTASTKGKVANKPAASKPAVDNSEKSLV